MFAISHFSFFIVSLLKISLRKAFLIKLFLNPYASKSLYGKIFRIRKGLSRE